MAREAELLAALERARVLLLTPDAAAMRECRQSLECAIGMLQADSPRNGAPHTEYGDQVKRTVQTVRFLLEQARAFWSGRRIFVGPCVQYCSGGREESTAPPSRFVIEV